MRPEYPHHMPDTERAKLDRVSDPELVKQLIALWYATQDYECQLAEGRDGFERHLEREKEKAAAVQRKGIFERALNGRMGPDAQEIAKHCVSTLVQSASQEALHKDFEAAWKAEQQGRQRKREQRADAAAQPDLYQGAR